MAFEERIDVHAHMLPPFYREACQMTGHEKPDNMPELPEWSVESHLALMKDLNISKSILSISSPGTSLTPGDHLSSRKLTRQCNDYAADICSQNSSLGFWASLPVLNLDDALQEIAHVFDTLNADGVTLETNYHGTYLGDSALDVIFDELNRRHAKVFIHPTSPCMKTCHGHGPTPAAALTQYPNPMFEFMFDSARAVVNLFLSGTLARCSNITFIIPHAGGSVSSIIERFTAFSAVIEGVTALSSEEVKDTLETQFYFDLAGLPFPGQIQGLLKYVSIGRLLYGSDYPFTPSRRLKCSVREWLMRWRGFGAKKRDVRYSLEMQEDCWMPGLIASCKEWQRKHSKHEVITLRSRGIVPFRISRQDRTPHR